MSEVLWDAGLVGNLKSDIVTVVNGDRGVAAMCFPQAGAVDCGESDCVVDCWNFS